LASRGEKYRIATAAPPMAIAHLIGKDSLRPRYGPILIPDIHMTSVFMPSATNFMNSLNQGGMLFD